MFQLERITFHNWPIEYNPKASLVKVFQFEKNTFIDWSLNALENLDLCECLICKNYLHVHWPIKCNTKVLVVGMYELIGITYICWPIKSLLQNPYFSTNPPLA